MNDRNSAAHKAEMQPNRIEPIFDASGALRRIPREAKQGSDDTRNFPSSRTTGHPAR